MAAPANKASSSTSQISSIQNPSARNSEISNPMRRSFSGNPFAKPSIMANHRRFNPNTPANSPSDFSRRNSIGRESVISSRDFDDKENGKDNNIKPARVRSPAASKGTKNFMSPTISAASKMNTSPRKKILAEKNEHVRSSVSFSDVIKVISEDSESRPEIVLNQKKLEASHDMTITDFDQKEALESNTVFDFKELLFPKNNHPDSLPEIVTEQKSGVTVDPSIEISPQSSSYSSPIMLARLDADPSMQTYDPKTNYLSPRPQFLHYRPNPRIELYFDKLKEGKQLEESFVSESSSDIEVAEEETQSEDSQKQSEDVYSGGEIMKEEEGDEAEVEEEELRAPEPNPVGIIHRPKESVEAEVAESSSDTEVAEEETQSEDSQKQSDDVSSGGETVKEEEGGEAKVEEEELRAHESNPVGIIHRPKNSVEAEVAESSSDTEVAEEETQTEDSQKQSEDVSLGVETVKEEEGDEAVVEEELISEPNPVGIIHRPKESAEPRFFTRPKFIALLLILSIACFSITITNSPAVESSMLTDLSFYKFYVPPEIIDFAKVNSNQLAENFRVWSANSISYICKLVSSLVEVQQLGPLRYGNLTGLLEDCSVDGYQAFDHRALVPIREREVEIEPLNDNGQQEIEADENVEEAIEKEYEAQGNTELISEEHFSEPEEVQQEIVAEVIEPASHIDNEPQGNTEVTSEELVNSEPEVLQEVVVAEVIEPAAHIDNEPQGNTEVASEELVNSEPEQEVVVAEVIEPDNSEQNLERVEPAAIYIEPQDDVDLEESAAVAHSEQRSVMVLKDQPGLISSAAEFQPEASEAGGAQCEIESTKAEENPESPEVYVSAENSQSSETVDSAVEGSEDKVSMQNVLGISLLVVSLLAAAAFISAKRGKPLTLNAAVLVEQPVVNRKLEYSPMSVSEEKLFQERLSSLNWQTEFDMVGGESCPSEMSSFQKSSTYGKKEGLKESNEAQSQERKARRNYKRESLATSEYSMASTSYGSFTTYEKISSKHGHGDEEVVTPVRRSSRLRNQVISP